MKYIETVKILVLNHIIKHLPVETQQHKQQEKVLNMLLSFFQVDYKIKYSFVYLYNENT